MKPVMQTDLSPGGGNALQACVASILGENIDSVPNFVKAPDYLKALQQWLKSRRLSLLKIELQNGRLRYATPGSLCILAGRSPRGNFRHAVVGLCLESGEFQVAFDPHPDGRGLVGLPIWAGFFVAQAVVR